MSTESKNLTRPQMLGMIAALRGAVHSLLFGDPSDHSDDVYDAATLLEETAGDASDEDLVDGGFDMSWSPRHNVEGVLESSERKSTVRYLEGLIREYARGSSDWPAMAQVLKTVRDTIIRGDHMKDRHGAQRPRDR